MRFRIGETRAVRKISVDVDIEHPEDPFILLAVDDDIEEAAGDEQKQHKSNRAQSTEEVRDLVAQSWDGFKSGRAPVLSRDGVGGTYFLRDAGGRMLGVFKPQDEEPFNINNPKGYVPGKRGDRPLSRKRSSGTATSHRSKRSGSAGPLSSLLAHRSRQKSSRPAPSDLLSIPGSAEASSGGGSLSSKGFREGVMVGEASIRESAAYLLDHHGFSGVPCTDLALCQHPALNSNGGGEHDVSDTAEETRKPGTPIVNTLRVRSPRGRTTVKLGSFQAYKDHDGDVDDVPPALLSQFPVDEVHKIAVLDVRLFNTDRHGGNILWVRRRDEEGEGGDKTEDGPQVTPSSSPAERLAPLDGDRAGPPAKVQVWRGRSMPRMLAIRELPSSPPSQPVKTHKRPGAITLIPIDHGYTLPSTLSEAEFVWLSWPQAKQPMSRRTLDYIRSLDAERDVRLLQDKFGPTIRPEVLRVLRISTMWLKKGAEAGLSLFDIGNALCRPMDRPSLPSALERMFFRAQRRLEETSPVPLVTADPSTPRLSAKHQRPSIVIDHSHAQSAPNVMATAPQPLVELGQDGTLLDVLSAIMDEEVSRLALMKAAKV
jgi:hypothetical protein